MKKPASAKANAGYVQCGLVVLRVPEDRKFIRLFAVSLTKIGVYFTRAEGWVSEGE